MKTHPAGRGQKRMGCGLWRICAPEIRHEAFWKGYAAGSLLTAPRCTQKTMSSSTWTLHHRRMLESLKRVLVSSLEEKCSCGISELYLQGWCPTPLTQFAMPSSLPHPHCSSSGWSLLKPNLQACTPSVSYTYLKYLDQKVTSGSDL